MNKVICTLFFLLSVLKIQAQVFEMRYFTKDKEASGVTDFHGPAEWLDTDQRVAMLNSYARYASRFWGDPGMDTPMFDETEVRERLAAVKPQPLTSVRRTVVLDSWRSYGYKDGKVEEQAERWKKWTDGGALIQDGFLLLDGVTASPEINPIDWRFNMKMTLETVDRDFGVVFSDEDGTLLEVALDGLSGNVEIYGDLECMVMVSFFPVATPSAYSSTSMEPGRRPSRLLSSSQTLVTVTEVFSVSWVLVMVKPSMEVV